MAISITKLKYIIYSPAVIGVLASLYETYNVINGKDEWVPLISLVLLTTMLLVVARFVNSLPMCPEIDKKVSNDCDKRLKTKVSTTTLVPLTDVNTDVLPLIDNLLANSLYSKKYRSLSELRNAFAKEPAMKCDVIMTDTTNVSGYIIYWDFDSVLYIEHVDIIEPLRNTGVGTAAMLHFIHNSFLPVVVEVIDNDLTEANIKFLNALGFSTVEHVYCKPSGDGICVPARMLVTEDMPDMKFDILKRTIHKHVYGCNGMNRVGLKTFVSRPTRLRRRGRTHGSSPSGS